MGQPFWLGLLPRRVHADALASRGGVVAFYTEEDSSIQRPSRWLDAATTYFAGGGTDAGNSGMHVVARNDPHATFRRTSTRTIRDWIAVDAEGRKRRTGKCPTWG